MARPEKVAVVEEIRDKLEDARRRGPDRVPRAHGRRAGRPAGALRAAERRVQGVQEHAGPPGGRRGRPRPTSISLLEGPTAIAFVQGRRRHRGQGAAGLRQDQRRTWWSRAACSAPGSSPPTTSIALADIQPREVLLARIAGGFQAPLVKAAGLFQAFTRNIAYGVKALIDQRVAGGEAPPPAEPPRPRPPRRRPADRGAAAEADGRSSSRPKPPAEADRRRPRPESRRPRRRRARPRSSTEHSEEQQTMANH